MKLVRLLNLTFIFVAFLMTKSHAQICQYTLNLYDSYGGGWYDNLLSVTVNGVSMDYTIPAPATLQPFTTATFAIPVAQGNSIKLDFTADFPYGVSWALIDNNADTVTFQVEKFNFPGLASGEYYSGFAKCGGCPKPKNVTVNAFAYTAKLRWASAPATFRVVYGLAGFNLAPGKSDTITTTQFKATLTGLYENTPYDAYILKDCSDGSISSVGPIRFNTYFSDDVGVSQVTSPVSDCDLGFETVTILLKNYGANPQSLIPFFYSVDGVPASIPVPNDGFYTGVLGKDSCEYIQFETQANLFGPGQHEIKVWTELMGDDTPGNDTVTYFLTNKISLPYEQSFETWSGGWHIDYDKSENPSWEVGKPDKNGLQNAVDGENCWVTNLTDNFNLEEESYLVSPCFDFSGTVVDPTIRFSLWSEADFFYDGLFLDITFDNGATWNRVGTYTANIVGNWYNNTNTNFGDVWTGYSDWTTTRHKLDGAKGKPSVQLRFGFASGPFYNQGGFAIDDIHIFEQKQKDATVISGASAYFNCGTATDKLTIVVRNEGSQIIASAGAPLKLSYKVDNLPTVTETPIAFAVPANTEKNYTFTAPFNSIGKHTIKFWTNLTGDLNLANDTSYIFINNVIAEKPLQENFEDVQLPENWITDFSTNVTDQHNNISYVLARNVYEFNPLYSVEMPPIGLIKTGDTLSFDYRITDFEFGPANGTVPTEIDLTTFQVEYSENCGDTWTKIYTINKQNHVQDSLMRKVKIGLNALNDKNVKFRIIGQWGEGDFWFDVDNFNIKGCPESFGLQVVANNDANQAMTLGSASITPTGGQPPFTYAWANGGTGNTQTNLANGSYFVTVTDKNGCTDVAFIVIEVASSTTEIDGLINFKLQPNPTSGLTMLSADFENATDATIQVTNLLGQNQFFTEENNAINIRRQFDLGKNAAGIYLVRLTVAGKTKVAKLILTK
jgi:Secretion system C-terminal sorting domain